MNQFKRAQVIILPTDKPTNIWLSIISKLLRWLSFTKDMKEAQGQHLYIISDDEIKEDDWIVWQNKVVRAINTAYHSAKKIIATTDTSLTIETRCTYDANDVDIFTLPKPSQQFIEKYIEEYNKGEVITDVLVEYYFTHETGYDKPLCIKVDKDNTITIKKLKDSWNKEEINTLFHEFADYIQPNTKEDHIQYDKWLNKNL